MDPSEFKDPQLMNYISNIFFWKKKTILIYFWVAN